MLIEKRLKTPVVPNPWQEITFEKLIEDIGRTFEAHNYSINDATRSLSVSLQIALTHRYETNEAEYRIL